MTGIEIDDSYKLWQDCSECEYCRAKNTKTNRVKFRLDPYIRNIHDEDRVRCMCENCFNTRAGDI